MLLIATSAHATEPKLAAMTQAYADKHGLPVRVVKNDLGTRQVERHFVPVLATTHEDFLSMFSIDHGAVVWRTASVDRIHGTLSVKPGYAISHGARNGDPYRHLPHAAGGNYLTLALDKEQLASWEALIDKYTPRGRNPTLGLWHFSQTNNPVYGGCMWWVSHAEVAPGLNLATLMGVRRAKGPEVLAPRLIHAGNELVGPVGIPVATVEQFNR